MKEFLMLGFLLTGICKTKAQDTLLIYLNQQWKKTNKENASYFRKAFKDEENTWKVKDYFICGKMQMTGSFTSKKFKKKEGAFKYFFKNGVIDCEGFYLNDKKEGIWTWYFKNGQVSAKETYNKGKIAEVHFWNEDGSKVSGGNPTIEYPEFVGGMDEMYNFLSRNLEYPQWAKINNVRGSVTVNFIVEEDGSIREVEAVKSVHPVLDRAAIEVVKKMPKWKPGKCHNRYHRTSMNLPINFKLSTIW